MVIPELDIEEALWLLIDGFGSRASDIRRARFDRLLVAIEDASWMDLYGYTPIQAAVLLAVPS